MTSDHPSSGSTPHGKHRPKSHPALHRLTLTGQSTDPEAVAQINDRLDMLALEVANLPDFPDLLTISQRDRLRIIARELLRRANR